MLTRQALLDGSFRKNAEKAVAAAKAVMQIRPEEESKRLFDGFFSARPKDDIWVFGYGSLMWNPAIEFERRALATLGGWRRSFCIRDIAGRGSPDFPGLSLSLEPGDSTNGLAFKLPKQDPKLELSLVWMREMLSDSYDAIWADVTVDGEKVNAAVFVANPMSERYVSGLSPSNAAAMIVKARGPFGTSMDYLSNAVKEVQTLGLWDSYLEETYRLAQDLVSKPSSL